ncbi:MAG: TetR/AcrR family transcriptional regulator [Bacteroidetes bacterium]|nr:TetR/AcrR family transcriptional regulator [Bacteroidota bacterium]
MAIGIKFSLNESLYIRDPQDTELGRNIIKYSIIMIDEIGFEAFTFRKLAKRMESTEASIYRYFKNKHMLLVYLVGWYWEWVSYLIEINTLNVQDPEEKLQIAICNVVSATRENPAIDYVNENILHRIVISDGVKAYHTKSVDEENKNGLFFNYKRMVEKISDIILEINPDFPYPRALGSNLFEMANAQIYFAQHLPRLTDVKLQDEKYEEVVKMLEYFAFGVLSKR